MQGRILRRRTHGRASRAGYTLIELMVVVMLIALLAMLAAPSMIRARSDRLAFAYARQVSETIHGARSRAAARGGAHLVVYRQTSSLGPRGAVHVFEALDGTTSGSTPPGPNPVASCRRPGQWTFAGSYTPGATDATSFAAFIEGVDFNSSAAGNPVVTENIRMRARFSDATATTDPVDTVNFVMCITPNGTTYFGLGGTVDAAITQMQASTTPFTNIIEIDVARHNAADVVVGLNRRVIMGGASAPRIRSE